MHFLGKNALRYRELGKPWASVTVRVAKEVLTIQPGGIGILRSDVQIARLPERFKVIGEDGIEVKPSKGKAFWITVESMDPYHAVCELED